MVSTFRQPDFTDQEPAAYKGAIDGAVAVLARLAAAFAPHEQDEPDMTVRLDAGLIPALGALPAEVAAQSTGTIAAPAADPRHDIVYIDRATGAVGVATGTEDASPADPAIPAGKVAVARVRLVPAQTEIVNPDLDDIRGLSVLGLGTAALLDIGAFGTAAAEDVQASGTGDLLREDGDGSALTGLAAVQVAYDNTASGLAATGVQDALDEVVAALGGGLQSVQVFTASGIWTKPAGIDRVVVEVVGGGGGSGGSNAGGGSTGGGGGGGYAKELIDVSAISSETVTVGTGGGGGSSAGSNGGTGGTSSFGAHCSATGGGGSNGSTGGSAQPGAGGGAGSGGDVNITGTGGLNITASPAARPGGVSLFGRSHGAGASGIAGNTGGTAGEAGVVIVWEYA